MWSLLMLSDWSDLQRPEKPSFVQVCQQIALSFG